MGEALKNLFSSRKFLVMLVTNLLVGVGAITGTIQPDTAAELATALVTVWMAAHAHEEKSKIEARTTADGLASYAAEMSKSSVPALPQNAGPSTPGVK